ncbi:hypothetical protein [Streptomyces sp. NPDC006739]|uniref:hypothetical protein n=1 Tax=Streptomyces sp. NPDC006739 TaxID=3364763 RepID=UPI0036B02FF3
MSAQELARTGHLARAVELAYSIDDERKQGEELLALVKTAAVVGDLCVAQELAESVPLRQRDEALLALVPAWARAGERDIATALAERIRYPHNWGTAWALLAKVAADNGDTDEALRFAARADAEAGEKEQVLALLVQVAAATGDHVRAAALADRVEAIARSGHAEGWPSRQPRAVTTVLAYEVLRGDLSRLDALLRSSARPAPDVCEPATGLPAPGETADEDVARHGELAETIACPRPPRPPLVAWDMACVLDMIAETADRDVALALADRAETLLETGDGRDHDILLEAVTLLLARHGQVERAMALADWLDPGQRAGRQAQIVGELARHGDTDRARTLAFAITDRRARTRALIEVVQELARHGEPGHAEDLARTITDRWAQGEALVEVVRELARRGDPDRAEALTQAITYRATRARALAALVERSAPPLAYRLATQIVLLDGWATALPVLEEIAPRAIAIIADQMTS